MDRQDSVQQQATVGTVDGLAEGGATRKQRGFATLDRQLVKELARRGGRAAHVAKTAHEFTSEEARVAGRKGGLERARRRVQGLERVVVEG